MKIAYILKKDLDETGKKIFEKHKAANDVTSVMLIETSANELLDLIESHDRVIMW